MINGMSAKEYVKAEQKTSMLYWWPLVWPLVRKSRVIAPRTEIVKIGHKRMQAWIDPTVRKDLPRRKVERINSLASYFMRSGKSMFIRTDYASVKHSWKKTCFVKSKENLWSNIHRLIEGNELLSMMPPPYSALIFREYIEPASLFTAFYGGIPIGVERRYIVKDGEVEDHFPYWPEEAISQSSRKDWKILLKQINEETRGEVLLLSKLAVEISKAVPGYWSVDFMVGKDSKVYFIDMADARLSWRLERKEIEK